VKRALLLALAVAGLSCRDFGAALAACTDAGRCSDGAPTGGGGGATGGGGGGDAGVDAGVDSGVDAGEPVAFYDECGLLEPDAGRPQVVCDNDAGVVEIIRQRHFVLEDETIIDVPFTDQVTLLTEDAGTWSSIAATQVDAGYWVATGVPVGEYLVEATVRGVPTLVQGCTRKLDLSIYRLGRPDVEPADQGALDDAGLPVPTLLNLNFSNLTNWQVGDDIQFLSPNAGIGYGSFTNPEQMPSGFLLTDGGIPGGATSAMVSYDWNESYFPNVIDASRGDSLRAVHLKAESSPDGLRYFAATATASANPPLTISPNAVNSTNLLFNAVSRGSAIKLRADLAGFSAASASTSVPVPDTKYFTVQPSPGRVQRGKIDAVPDTVYTHFEQVDGGVSSEAVVPLSISFGNPFPGPWGQLAEVGVRSHVDLAFIGRDGGQAQTSIAVWATHVFDGAQLHADAGFIELHGGLVAAQDLTADGAIEGALGSSPRLRWAAPGSCRPDFWTVTLVRLEDSLQVIKWVGPGTQAHLPPALMPAPGGHSYVFRVLGSRQPRLDPSAPLLTTTPEVQTAGLPAGLFIR
jgi:hypothetical protein